MGMANVAVGETDNCTPATFLAHIFSSHFCSHPRHHTTMTDVQCFIESIDKQDGHQSYRRAIAPKTMVPGQVISREEPFATVLMRTHAHKYCAHCFVKFDQEGRPGKRCTGGCEFTYYCGRQCQSEHHRTIHKHTCKRYATVVGQATQKYSRGSSSDFPFEDFMLARAVYIVLCQRNGISVKEHKLDGMLTDEILVLCEGPADGAPTKEEQLLASAVVDSFGFEGNERAKATLFFTSLLLKFRHNNFGIQNELQQVIASGMFPRGAILNHSCDPNCILTYEGSKQIITTIRPVGEGEELFHSYTDICQPTAVRQESLLKTYGFQCDCGRCQGIGQWKHIEAKLVGGNDLLSIEDTKAISLSLLMAEKMSSDEEDDLQREYKMLRRALAIQTEKLDRFNVERYNTECLAMNVALLMGSEEALAHARAIVDFLSFVCNERHPLLLLQRRTLSELEAVFGQ